jgi:hypothetical protein
MYIDTYTYTDTHMHIHTYLHTHTCTHIHTYLHTHTDTHIHTYRQIYTKISKQGGHLLWKLKIRNYGISYSQMRHVIRFLLLYSTALSSFKFKMSTSLRLFTHPTTLETFPRPIRLAPAPIECTHHVLFSKCQKKLGIFLPKNLVQTEQLLHQQTRLEKSSVKTGFAPHYLHFKIFYCCSIGLCPGTFSSELDPTFWPTMFH